MGKLFLENGEPATIYDIAQFWCETYPADVFVTAPAPVVKVRESMVEILNPKNVRG